MHKLSDLSILAFFSISAYVRVLLHIDELLSVTGSLTIDGTSFTFGIKKRQVSQFVYSEPFWAYIVTQPVGRPRLLAPHTRGFYKHNLSRYYNKQSYI